MRLRAIDCVIARRRFLESDGGGRYLSSTVAPTSSN